jgi:hypothetical protein
MMKLATTIDIETLGVKPDCVVLTIGAVKFDPLGDFVDRENGLYFRLNVDQQTDLGRTTDQGTLDWWSTQDPAVLEEALSDDNRTDVAEVLAALNRFLVGSDDIWCQGPVFDICILENLYRMMGQPIPWNYWQIRDSRTLFQVYGDPRSKSKGLHHNALEDCVDQSIAVQTLLKKVGHEKLRGR